MRFSNKKKPFGHIKYTGLALGFALSIVLHWLLTLDVYWCGPVPEVLVPLLFGIPVILIAIGVISKKSVFLWMGIGWIVYLFVAFIVSSGLTSCPPIPSYMWPKSGYGMSSYPTADACLFSGCVNVNVSITQETGTMEYNITVYLIGGNFSNPFPNSTVITRAINNNKIISQYRLASWPSGVQKVIPFYISPEKAKGSQGLVYARLVTVYTVQIDGQNRTVVRNITQFSTYIHRIV
jgi:hypothetical protein